MLLSTLKVTSPQDIEELQDRKDIGFYPERVMMGLPFRFKKTSIFEVHQFHHEQVQDDPDGPEIYVVFAPELREGFLIFNYDTSSVWGAGESAADLFHRFFDEPTS